MATTQRTINGLLCVDKPAGISSRRVVDTVVRRFDRIKAGHCGTLDPAAEGLLIIGIGRGTRAMEHLLTRTKTYRAQLQLGIQTDTGDLQGQVIQREAVQSPSEEQILQIFSGLQGDQTQVAPRYSALKHQGKAFYKLARDNQEVPHRERKVSIYSLQLLSIEKEHVAFEVQCSKGTYIRTLCEEIAARLGTVGCMSSLRRLAIGQFTVEDSIDYHHLAEGEIEELLTAVIPVEKAFHDLNRVAVEHEAARAFCMGQILSLQTSSSISDCEIVRVYDSDNGFLGLGEHGQSRLKPLKVLAESV